MCTSRDPRWEKYSAYAQTQLDNKACGSSWKRKKNLTPKRDSKGQTARPREVSSNDNLIGSLGDAPTTSHFSSLVLPMRSPTRLAFLLILHPGVKALFLFPLLAVDRVSGQSISYRTRSGRGQLPVFLRKQQIRRGRRAEAREASWVVSVVQERDSCLAGFFPFPGPFVIT